MREILFRGWTIGEFTWEYGFLSWLDTPRERGYFINNKRIDERTLGQFTGMTDKNGKKIFEGDIIQFGSQRGSISEVKYIEKNAGFLVKDRWGDWHWLYDICASTHCDVIGNIHDNKELLS